MARTRTSKAQTSPPNVDPHHGHGGSYAIAGGVNHDVESEGARELVERTEHRVVASVQLEEEARIAAEKKASEGGDAAAE